MPRVRLGGRSSNEATVGTVRRKSDQMRVPGSSWPRTTPDAASTVIAQHSLTYVHSLPPGKTRRKPGDGSKQLPHSEDPEQIYQVAKVFYYLGDGLAGHKRRSPMHQVRHPSC